MARKRRRGSGARNLLLLLVLTIVVGAAAVGIRFLNREPVYIFDEDVSVIVEARNADNAWDALNAVAAQLPGEDPVVQPRLQELERQVFREPIAPGVVASLVPFDGSETANALVAYLEKSVPAAQAAHAAVQMKTVDPPEMPGFLEDAPKPFNKLGVVLLALGTWHNVNGRTDEALASWTDAIRLARLISPLDRWVLAGFQLEKRVLAEIMAAAKAQSDPGVLDRMRAAVNAVGVPYSPKSTVFTSHWERIDLSLRKPPRNDNASMGQRIGMRFFMREVDGLAQYIRENKQQLLELADKPPKAISDWLNQNLDQRRLDRGMFLMVHRMADRVAGAYEVDTYYHGALIVLALERFQRERGAYPAALEELVPALLPAVPQDALAGAPFVYRSQSGSYQLFGWGRDGVDNSGDPNLDYLIIM